LREVGRAPQPLAGAHWRLHAADFDNNGAVDLLLARIGPPAAGTDAAGGWLWLAPGGNSEATTSVTPPPALGPPAPIPALAQVHAIADLDGDGRLDLIGLDAQGRPAWARNEGTRGYHWQVVRPQAAQAFGDQRINPFGVGGEVELRAGGIVQRRAITGPRVHFGLGEQAASEVIRIHWPNGVMQAEFETKADQAVAAEQRLKGSCPFLFAWDGQQMRFVKDAVPWGSAIGLRINTIGTARVEATEEWYRIGRDELVPRHAFYELRITAELWEVYYYDHLALMTVDHPPGTEVYVDERFVIPPLKPQVVVVDTPQPIARALDDKGRDVTGALTALDGRSVDGFRRGQYQGVAHEHFVQVELPEHALTGSAALLLIAHGSLRPTDSSINVALSQGSRWRPQGLSLEVPDGRGGWRTARKDLGFPAGRKKIVLLDLAGLFDAKTPAAMRQVRIRTNLEIYWDQMQWAHVRPDVVPKVTRLDPVEADLHYRGYSVLTVPPAGAPEVPEYTRLAGTAVRWRDLEGYYTRHGDVRELLQRIDDRYVIMNAGDELSLRFAEPPAAPAGWLRDFVIAGDGWIKDGDYNSTFSRTVQPLPHHGQNLYVKTPGRLEDEPAWQRHRADWEQYHTRYVTDQIAPRALGSRAVLTSGSR
jgi:hypothetical protein